MRMWQDLKTTTQTHPLICYFAYEETAFLVAKPTQSPSFPVEIVLLRAILLSERTFMEQTRGKSN